MADRECCGNGFGGVIRVDPASGTQAVVSAGDKFVDPAGIAIVPPLDLVAAVLPSSRSVTVGTPATAFATIINAGPQTATNCRLVPGTLVPATFAFQTTDPTTNAVVGTPDTPVAIPPGGLATFVFAFTPTAEFGSTDVEIDFVCSNTASAPIVTGLNTLLLTASATPVPDTIALAATTTSDGRVRIPAANGAHAFAVASTNVGAPGTITVTADTGGTVIPINTAVCQTNPSTGVCMASPAESVTQSIASSETPTFGVFVQASGAVAFNPTRNRIFVRFKDAEGITRGSTSVAVDTPQ